jgi:hypothetical protein
MQDDALNAIGLYQKGNVCIQGKKLFGQHSCHNLEVYLVAQCHWKKSKTTNCS